MSGRYRNRFELQTRTETLDAYGDATLSYTLLMYAWGSLNATSATERNAVIGTEAESSHRIVLPYSDAASALTAADRIVLGTRTFDVVSIVDPDGRRRTLELTVREFL